MTMRCFIFASAADYALAKCAQKRLCSQGASAVIALDKMDAYLAEADTLITDFPRSGRLFGVAAAAGIADTIRSNMDGFEVAAKVDADTILFRSGFDWLAGASLRARGFRLTHSSKWSGIWAAPKSAFTNAPEAMLAATDCNGCPEAHLFWSWFKRHTGIERAHPEALQVFRSASPVRSNAMLLTLPTSVRHPVRATECEAMHAAAAAHRSH